MCKYELIKKLDQSTSTTDENKEDTGTSDGGEYSFGQKFYYWKHFKTKDNEDTLYNPGRKFSDWYIDKKYNTFKDEIVRHLDIERFNSTKQKAIHLEKNSQILRQMRSRLDSKFDPDTKYYEIRNKSPLTADRIMSILFYTDYTQLCTTFSGTFRKQSSSETDESLKKRHSEFWHWSKLLNETVHCWGERLNYDAKRYHHSDQSDASNINILYHGVSYIYFHGFLTRFMSPTSMTPQVTV